MRKTRRCYGCFDEFVPDHERVHYCSIRCRNLVAWEKTEARLLDTGATDASLEMHRRRHPRYHVKRALNIQDKEDLEQYAKAMGELRSERIKAGEMQDIDLGELIERDRGICHICGGKVDKRGKFGKRGAKRGDMTNYPTVDHVVPISRGGSHTWNNVKLAHLSCNAKKGGREQ